LGWLSIRRLVISSAFGRQYTDTLLALFFDSDFGNTSGYCRSSTVRARREAILRRQPVSQGDGEQVFECLIAASVEQAWYCSGVTTEFLLPTGRLLEGGQVAIGQPSLAPRPVPLPDDRAAVSPFRSTRQSGAVNPRLDVERLELVKRSGQRNRLDEELKPACNQRNV